jgi:hypothetical protein
MRLVFAVCVAGMAATLAQPLRPNHAELRALLVNDRHDFTVLGGWYSIFYYEDKLRLSIRAFLRDPETRENARKVLAFIGDPNDLRLVLRQSPPAGKDPFSNRWAYDVASALLEPSTELEWAFLRACALNDYQDRWVDAGAIQTHKLIASPRSLRILQEAQQVNVDREKSLADAIGYIQSQPPALRGPNLEPLAGRVANLIRMGNWEVKKPRYNECSDKALVDLMYSTPGDRFTYTGTFHRIDGMWRLRGLRQTFHAAIMRLPESPVDIPSPPELRSVPPLPQSTPEMILQLIAPKSPLETLPVPPSPQSTQPKKK